MFRTIVKLLNGLISAVIGLALLFSGAYAVYCLWDNQQIYAAAENLQADLLLLKPAKVENGETGPTFDDLLAINPDVCAWVSVDGTKIDHPVLQGESNLDYINTDVYGKFALAGSIFLDSRNKNDFTDGYSILYGHHMEKSAMFGDLDKFLDKKFFEENTSGELSVPGKTYALEIFACIHTKASEDKIFEPKLWSDGIGGLLDFAEAEGLYFHAGTIKRLRENIGEGKALRILALTTCSSDFTDARIIVLTAIKE